jgi:hypothetical protein
MKKTIALVILITFILIGAFAGLVYYATVHFRGVPVKVEEVERPVVDVPFVDKEIDVSKDISADVWNGITGKEIPLMYQVTVLPWPMTVVPKVLVKAFRNQKDIYFYLSWEDDSEDRIHSRNEFSDGCAIMFPLGEETPPPSIMMGFIGKTNIWYWKASQDKEFWQGEHPSTEAYADFHYPFEEQELFVVSKDVPESAISDLLAVRIGTVTTKDNQKAIEGRGFWKDGLWQVVFKRPLEALDLENDAVFTVGEKQLCAFSAWSGSKGDRGGRKSISDWVELEIK